MSSIMIDLLLVPIFRVGFMVVVMMLTVAILITLAIATIATPVAAITSCGAQVGHPIENNAEDLGTGAVHQVDRVAGLLAGGFILTGDKDTVVGIITDQGGIVKDADRRSVEDQDVKLLLEAGDQLVHARIFKNAAGMSGGTTGAE